MTIEQIVEARKIKQLVHFTRLENLDSILNYGLRTRGDCLARNIGCVHTDDYRLDHQEATCLSITFPNYKMFFRYRMQNPNSRWAVVGIRPSVLWEKDCAFCKENAASANVSGIPIEDRRGLAAFSGIFDDFGDKKRADLKIPDSYPTNPQAEVLVFDPIGTENILGVAFEQDETVATYSQRYGARFRFARFPSLFRARGDYAAWKRTNG
jgi:ssDNA thymidine ADP-ribosyltransferase, DarT